MWCVGFMFWTTTAISWLYHYTDRYHHHVTMCSLWSLWCSLGFYLFFWCPMNHEIQRLQVLCHPPEMVRTLIVFPFHLFYHPCHQETWWCGGSSPKIKRRQKKRDPKDVKSESEHAAQPSGHGAKKPNRIVAAIWHWHVTYALWSLEWIWNCTAKPHDLRGQVSGNQGK